MQPDGFDVGTMNGEAMGAAVPRRDSTVQSITRALDILDIFRDRASVSVTEAAQLCGLHKSTAHRLLATLERAGYVVQDSETDRYSLGLRILGLANALLSRLDLRSHALPEMRQLMQDTGETVHLGILVDLEVACIESVVSTRPNAIASMVGKRTHPHTSSMGKAILAHQGPDAIEWFIAAKALPGLTPHTITDPTSLRRHLELVRQRHYAVNDEEEEIGIRCVAVPIWNQHNEAVAALSVAAPAPRLSGSRLDAVTRTLLLAARRVSQKLGAL